MTDSESITKGIFEVLADSDETPPIARGEDPSVADARNTVRNACATVRLDVEPTSE